MEYVQMTLDDWVSIKEQLKKDLLGVQESFVRIGYTLRRIEDQKLYKKDGYVSIANFAKAEYGLEASTVSRFISINRKYSIDGYSDRLRPEFAELGSSKLTEMLTLPDGDMEMIRPEATRESIRELKRFNKAEPEFGVADDIRELIEQFYEKNREILNKLYSSEAYTTGEIDKLVEIVNPGGNKTFRRGLFILIMYEDNIKIKKIGENPQTMDWSEFFAITQDIFAEAAAGPNTWENHFKGGTDERGEYEKKDSGGGSEVTGDTEGISEDREERGAGHSDTRKDEGRSDEPVKPENDDTSDAGIGDAREDSGTAGVLDGADHTRTGTTKDDSRAGENGIGAAECSEKQETEKTEEKAVAPAQKSAETIEREASDEAQKKGNYGAAEGEVQESEPEEAAGEETKETESGFETMNQPEVIEKPYGSRKDYMDTLTAYGMAMYMAEEYERHNLKASFLAFPSELEKWLLQEVDENGQEIERGEKS